MINALKNKVKIAKTLESIYEQQNPFRSPS